MEISQTKLLKEEFTNDCEQSCWTDKSVPKNQSCCGECTNLSMKLLKHQIENHRASIFTQRHTKILNILLKIQKQSLQNDNFEILTSIIKVSQNCNINGNDEVFFRGTYGEFQSEIKTETVLDTKEDNNDEDATTENNDKNQTILPPFVEDFDKFILDDKKSIDYVNELLMPVYSDDDKDDDNNSSRSRSTTSSNEDRSDSTSIPNDHRNKRLQSKIIETVSNKESEKIDCKSCGKKFLNKKSLNTHKLKIHRKDKNDIKTLPVKSSKKKINDESHENDSNTNKRKKKLKQKGDNIGEEDENLAIDNKKFTKCDDCGKYFLIRAMYYHKKTYHGVAYHTEKAKKLKEYQNTADPNEKSNENFISYSCDICDKTVRSKQTLRHHLKTKHSSHPKTANAIDPTYKCEECDQMFTGLMKYRGHMHLIHPDKPWMPQRQRDTLEVNLCDLCGNEFPTRGQLKSHQIRHINERKFKCTICEKDFLQKVHLKDHLNSHSGEKPYKCIYEGCTREFAYASGRVAHHKIVHEVLKKYKCEFCPREYGLKSRLKDHRRVHTGERPYACEFCPDRFKAKGHLRAHRNIHTGERPYKCNLCNRGFTNYMGLKQHRLAKRSCVQVTT